MKEKVVKLVKGGSLVYVSVRMSAGGGYSVSLGGNCGIHDHETKASAMAEFRQRIGYLVSNGYTAEPCDEEKR